MPHFRFRSFQGSCVGVKFVWYFLHQARCPSTSYHRSFCQGLSHKKSLIENDVIELMKLFLDSTTASVLTEGIFGQFPHDCHGSFHLSWVIGGV